MVLVVYSLQGCLFNVPSAKHVGFGCDRPAGILQHLRRSQHQVEGERKKPPLVCSPPLPFHCFVGETGQSACYVECV